MASLPLWRLATGCAGGPARPRRDVSHAWPSQTVGAVDDEGAQTVPVPRLTRPRSLVSSGYERVP